MHQQCFHTAFNDELVLREQHNATINLTESLPSEVRQVEGMLLPGSAVDSLASQPADTAIDLTEELESSEQACTGTAVCTLLKEPRPWASSSRAHTSASGSEPDTGAQSSNPSSHGIEAIAADILSRVYVRPVTSSSIVRTAGAVKLGNSVQAHDSCHPKGSVLADKTTSSPLEHQDRDRSDQPSVSLGNLERVADDVSALPATQTASVPDLNAALHTKMAPTAPTSSTLDCTIVPDNEINTLTAIKKSGSSTTAGVPNSTTASPTRMAPAGPTPCMPAGNSAPTRKSGDSTAASPPYSTSALLTKMAPAVPKPSTSAGTDVQKFKSGTGTTASALNSAALPTKMTPAVQAPSTSAGTDVPNHKSGTSTTASPPNSSPALLTKVASIPPRASSPPVPDNKSGTSTTASALNSTTTLPAKLPTNLITSTSASTIVPNNKSSSASAQTKFDWTAALPILQYVPPDRTEQPSTSTIHPTHSPTNIPNSGEAHSDRNPPAAAVAVMPHKGSVPSCIGAKRQRDTPEGVQAVAKPTVLTKPSAADKVSPHKQSGGHLKASPISYPTHPHSLRSRSGDQAKVSAPGVSPTSSTSTPPDLSCMQSGVRGLDTTHEKAPTSTPSMPTSPHNQSQRQDRVPVPRTSPNTSAPTLLTTASSPDISMPVSPLEDKGEGAQGVGAGSLVSYPRKVTPTPSVSAVQASVLEAFRPVLMPGSSPRLRENTPEHSRDDQAMHAPRSLRARSGPRSLRLIRPLSATAFGTQGTGSTKTNDSPAPDMAIVAKDMSAAPQDVSKSPEVKGGAPGTTGKSPGAMGASSGVRSYDRESMGAAQEVKSKSPGARGAAREVVSKSPGARGAAQEVKSKSPEAMGAAQGVVSKRPGGMGVAQGTLSKDPGGINRSPGARIASPRSTGTDQDGKVKSEEGSGKFSALTEQIIKNIKSRNGELSQLQHQATAATHRQCSMPANPGRGRPADGEHNPQQYEDKWMKTEGVNARGGLVGGSGAGRGSKRVKFSEQPSPSPSFLDLHLQLATGDALKAAVTWLRLFARQSKKERQSQSHWALEKACGTLLERARQKAIKTELPETDPLSHPKHSCTEFPKDMVASWRSEFFAYDKEMQRKTARELNGKWGQEATTKWKPIMKGPAHQADLPTLLTKPDQDHTKADEIKSIGIQVENAAPLPVTNESFVIVADVAATACDTVAGYCEAYSAWESRQAIEDECGSSEPEKRVFVIPQEKTAAAMQPHRLGVGRGRQWRQPKFPKANGSGVRGTSTDSNLEECTAWEKGLTPDGYSAGDSEVDNGRVNSNATAGTSSIPSAHMGGMNGAAHGMDPPVVCSTGDVAGRCAEAACRTMGAVRQARSTPDWSSSSEDGDDGWEEGVKRRRRSSGRGRGRKDVGGSEHQVGTASRLSARIQSRSRREDVQPRDPFPIPWTPFDPFELPRTRQNTLFPPDCRDLEKFAAELRKISDPFVRMSRMDELLQRRDARGSGAAKILGLEEMGLHELARWSRADQALFERGITALGPRLDEIRRDFLPHRSIAEVTSFHMNLWRMKRTRAAAEWYASRAGDKDVSDWEDDWWTEEGLKRQARGGAELLQPTRE